jgi:hypothetical protein
LAVDPIASAASGFVFLVERFYAGLISAVDWPAQVSFFRPGNAATGANPGSEPNLGGKLLYAGELDAEARALLVAANIAGAASLTVAAEASAGKQAIRDGVVDFLVTSLDEALRILKNEIRKRETVAVCVALPPGTPEADFAREMLERGVAPDLARQAAIAASPALLERGTARVEPVDARQGQVLVAWSVAAAPALWLPKLDAIALDCLQRNLGAPEPDLSLSKACPEPVEGGLDSETWDFARRWLRLAPRYLGRLAQGVRVLRCGERVGADFLERVRERVESGEIGVAVELSLSRDGQPEQYSFAPRTG